MRLVWGFGGGGIIIDCTRVLTIDFSFPLVWSFALHTSFEVLFLHLSCFEAGVVRSYDLRAMYLLYLFAFLEYIA